jgi:ABC-type glutathione transport system ATPase component
LRPPHLGETKIIGIDGHGGAGKSTLAQLLAHASMPTSETWFADEEGYIRRDDPRSHADVVVDGTKPFEGQLS